MEYGVQLPGLVITDPSWTCEADVIAAQHGLGLLRPGGALVTREHPAAPWHQVHPTPGGPA